MDGSNILTASLQMGLSIIKVEVKRGYATIFSVTLKSQNTYFLINSGNPIIVVQFCLKLFY